MTRTCFAVALLFGAVVAEAQAGPGGSRANDSQTNTPAAPPQFRSGVDLVSLDVCVRTRDGRPTAGLKAEDFLVLENNVPQHVALFSADGRVRLAVALLVDSSASMSGRPLDRARVAAAGFIRTLRSDDLVEVMSFNEQANLRYPFGMDHEQAKLSLNAVSAVGMTRLYDAALVALNRLQRKQHDVRVEYRNVMILLSDGEDTASRLAFDDVLEQVRRSDVLVYTVSLRTDRRDRVLAPAWQMARIAHDTGGRAVAVRDPAGLAQAYHEIGVELLHLYRLGYVPSTHVRDGSWRSVSVRVPAKDLVVRTRTGYYAPRPPSNLVRKPDL